MSLLKSCQLFTILLVLSACGGQQKTSHQQLAFAPSMPAPISKTMTFQGNRANYSIKKSLTNFTVLEVQSNTTTFIGADIDTLIFADSSVNLLISQKAKSISSAKVAQIEELYVAFFNRIPDADGLSYWIDQVAAGASITQVAESFYFAAIEFTSTTGYSANMSNTDFIKIVYKNVLGRSSVDAEGMNYWLNSLSKGTETRGSLVSTILNAAHSFKGDATYGWVADLLDNKLVIADYFAIQQGLSYATPSDSITKGMAIAAAITSNDTQVAKALIQVGVDANGSIFAEPSISSWQTAGRMEMSNDFNVIDANVNTSLRVDTLVAVGPNGDAMIIWEQSDGIPNGSTRKAFFRRFTAGVWEAAEAIPNLSTSSNSVALVKGKLLMDSAGVTTWIRNDNMQTRRHTPKVGWGSAFSPIPAMANVYEVSDATMDNSGNIHLMVSGNDVFTTGNANYISLSSGASAWGTWTRLDNAATGLKSRDAKIAVSSNGSALSIWKERNPGDSYYSMKAARFASTWSAPEAIETSFDAIMTENAEPALVIDAQGNGIAMWRQGNNLYHNVYRVGKGWAGAVAVDTGLFNSINGGKIQLAMSPDGRAVATWTSAADGNFASLRSMQYHPNTGWSQAVTVDTYNTDTIMLMDNHAQAVIMYMPTLSNSMSFDLVSRRLNHGGTWSAATAIETEAGDIKRSRFAMNASGKGVAVWVQNDVAGNSARNSLWAAVLK